MKAKVKATLSLVTACLPAIIYVVWLNAYYWLLKGGRYKAFIQPKLWPPLFPNFDIATKRRKKHKNKFLIAVISIGYEIEIPEI